MIRAALLVALGLASATAAGQSWIELEDEPPQVFVREALASPYGQALARRFGDLLRNSASATCARQRDLDLARMASFGFAILEKRGTQMLERSAAQQDRGRYEMALAALAGPEARDDLARLRSQPEVQRFLALSRPARQARVLDELADTLDRYAQQRAIGLKGRLSPVATRDEEALAAHPEMRARAEASAFARQAETPSLRRWLELDAARRQAARHAQGTSALAPDAAVRLIPGLEYDFAPLCVASGV